jgi:hypothetical protein
MKLLVATTRTQGQRKNDFCFVPEDEIVHFAFECDGEKVDGGCGCRRSMSGIVCRKATTTMKVADVEISITDLKGLLFDYFCSVWKYSPVEALKSAGVEGNELLRVAQGFEVGAIVEKRGPFFQQRKDKP